MKTNLVPLTDWGRETKIRLMALGKTQSWLIQEVACRTGRYFDSGWMQKMLTGKSEYKRKKELIDQILTEEEEKSCVR